MPALEVMEITVSGAESPRIATTILQSLKIPALTDLSITTPVSSEREWERLFPKFNDYAVLKRASFTFPWDVDADDSNDIEEFSPLELILTRFRNLQHLPMDSENVYISVSVPDNAKQAPPLRTLRLGGESFTGPGRILPMMQYFMRSVVLGLAQAVKPARPSPQ
jgi:hypothetical protein